MLNSINPNPAIAELIKFPVPNTDDVVPFYYVMDGEDEIQIMHNLPNARNVARLISQDWPSLNIWVCDENNVEVFRPGHEA